MGRIGHGDRKSRAQNVDKNDDDGDGHGTKNVNIPVLNTNNLIF